MDEALRIIGGTPIPSILVIAGLFFLFIAIGGQFGAKIITDKVKQRYAALVGVALIIIGLLIFLCAHAPEGHGEQGGEGRTGQEIPQGQSTERPPGGMGDQPAVPEQEQQGVETPH